MFFSNLYFISSFTDLLKCGLRGEGTALLQNELSRACQFVLSRFGADLPMHVRLCP